MYRSKTKNKTKQKKKNCCKSNKKQKDVKKGRQNHKMWGRKVRKSRLSFRLFFFKNVFEPM